MNRTLTIIAVAALTGAVGGCATPSYHTPVEVTRFTAAPAASLPRGAISLRPAPGRDAADPTYAAFQTAIADRLVEAGYQISGNSAPYVAQIDVERSVVDSGGKRRGPVSVGGGASTGGYGSGVGLGVGINLTPPDPDTIDTRLAVSIRPAAGGDAIWEGRASFTATQNNELANLTAAAAKMSSALFQGFPGNSGETIEVK